MSKALQLAESTAREVNGLLEAARTLLVTLARTPTIRRGERAACERLLTEVGRATDRYVGFRVTSLDGTPLCAQADPTESSLVGSAPREIGAARGSGELLVGGFHRIGGAGAGALPIALAFADESGRPAGLIGTGLDLGWLGRHLADLPMPPGTLLDIADRHNRLALRLPGPTPSGRPLSAEFPWMLTAGGAGSLEGQDTDGAQRIVAYVPPAMMLDRSLLVSVGLSPEAALAPLGTARRHGALLIGLGLLLALLAAWLARRTFILQPATALLQAAGRWRAGDYGARVGLSRRHAAFGRLGAAFDDMAASLEAHEREIGRTLQALRVSQERFRAAQEVSPDGFAILRTECGAQGGIGDFTLIYANARMAELLRLGEGELAGRSLLELRPEAGGEGTLLRRFARVVETGQPDDIEFDEPGGRWLRSLTVRLEDGVAVRVSDITRRKRIDEALRESEERFRQFAENSHDVLWIVGGPRGDPEYVSRGFNEVWGRQPDELTSGGLDFLATVHPDDRDLVALSLASALAGESRSATYRIVRPDGEVRWVRDSSFPIRDAAGAIIRAGGICRDIKALKLIEDERERALREREAMLREINHRVKNNLQVIVSLLRLQANRSTAKEVREAFDEACGRVSTITELHLALFDGAQVGSLDFGAYLHDLCARLEASTRSVHTAEIRIEVAAERGAIDLDRAIPLGLIVNELVGNAVRHGFPDGRGGTVRVGFAQLDGHYRLSVRDDGTGPSAGVHALPQGLGMQLVDGFVRRIRGRLSLKGGPGLEAVVVFPVQSERQPREGATPG